MTFVFSPGVISWLTGLKAPTNKLQFCTNRLPTISCIPFFLFFFFFWEKEEPPVCVAGNTTITVKHILIECADLLGVRKKYFEERTLYSLFRNVNPRNFWPAERDWHGKYRIFWSIFLCGEVFYFSCDIESLWFCRNVCVWCVCVFKLIVL